MPTAPYSFSITVVASREEAVKGRFDLHSALGPLTRYLQALFVVEDVVQQRGLARACG